MQRASAISVFERLVLGSIPSGGANNPPRFRHGPNLHGGFFIGFILVGRILIARLTSQQGFQPAREMLKLHPSIFRDYGDYSQLKLRREVSLNSQARPWPEASNNNKFAVFTLKKSGFML